MSATLDGPGRKFLRRGVVMKQLHVALAIAVCVLTRGARAEEEVVWRDSLDGPYVPVNATLDIHSPHALGEPPWLSDTELNCAGWLPTGWYAGFVSWHGFNARHWGVTQDTVDKTEGTASMRLAYASFGATEADITDIYLGRKFPTVPGQRYVLRFDHKMDRMGEFWDFGDNYNPPRERGWCQYSVVLSGSLADMPGIEDYPPCHYNGYDWCKGEPGCPCDHPMTRYIFYTDGQWKTYEYEFTATGTETAFVWDFRKNRVFPGDPVISPGDGYHLDNIVLSTVDYTGRNRAANGDFADGANEWIPWTVNGTPLLDASAGEMVVAGNGFNGGVYQRVYTGGAGNVIMVKGTWRGEATTATSPRAEVLVINTDRNPVDGVDETGGGNGAILMYRNTGATGWDDIMPASSDIGGGQYQISFTAADTWATVVLRAANNGGASSEVAFDDIEVRSVPAPASLASLPEGFSKRSASLVSNHYVALGENPISHDIYAVKNDGSSPVYRIDPNDAVLKAEFVANMTELGLEFQSGAEGLTFDEGGNLYVSSHEGDIIKGTYVIITDTYTWSTFLDLPEADVGGWHGVNGMAVDHAGEWLYVCSGTTKNETQANWWVASNLEGRVLRCRMDPTLTSAQRLATVETFVQGIRNTFDITFRSDGALFGVDNSPDPFIGCDYGDEFNLIQSGFHYGWPHRYASDLSGADDSFACTVPPSGGELWGASLANYGPDGRPASGGVGYQDGGIYYGLHPHSSPDGVTFYEPLRMDPAAVKFPQEFIGRAFIARWGQGADPNIGHDVLSVRLDPDDSGYLCNTFIAPGSSLSNPIDVLAAYNGKLYILDWGGSPSQIHEISYVQPAGPVILTNPGTIQREVFFTENLADDTFEVINDGSATLEYSISDDASWLDVVPAAGMAGSSPVVHTIEYDVDGLPVGTYNATIEVTDPAAANSPYTMTVVVDVWTVRPDLDHDKDVDQSDHGFLQECFTGVAAPTRPLCIEADFNRDGYVNQADFAILETCFSGANVMFDKYCDGVHSP